MGIIPVILTSYTSLQSSSDCDFDDTMANSNEGESQQSKTGEDMIDFDRKCRKEKIYPM